MWNLIQGITTKTKQRPSACMIRNLLHKNKFYREIEQLCIMKTWKIKMTELNIQNKRKLYWKGVIQTVLIFNECEISSLRKKSYGMLS